MLKSIACLLGVLFVPAAFAGRLEAKVIYGDDDRKEVFELTDLALQNLSHSTAMLVESFRLDEANAEEFRLQGPSFGEEYGLCAAEPFREQPAVGFCSAFLVAPDMVATAGHCLSTQSECDGTRFVFGYGMHQAGEDMTRVAKSKVFSCKRIVERVEMRSGADYGLIQLDRVVEGVAPMTLAREPVANQDTLQVLGHPAGIPLKVGAGYVRSAAPRDFMVTNLDTYGGNSGSAVVRTSDLAVVGILVRGEQDFIYRGGCRLSNQCSNEGCRGEDVTRIGFIADALAKPRD
jgi:hypothetical protein